MVSTTINAEERSLGINGLPLLKYTDYMVEEGAPLTVEDALTSSQWRKAPKDGFLGLVSPPHWFRIDLTSYHQKAVEQLLEIDFQTLDYVDAYYYIDGVMVAHYQTGDSRDFSIRPIHHRLPLFPVPYTSEDDLIVYLRVETSAVLKMPIVLWSKKDFKEKEQQVLIWHGMFMGALLFLVVYNVFLGLTLRRLGYLYYSMALASVVSMELIREGYGAQFLWPSSYFINNDLFTISIQISIIAMVLFSIKFLSINQAVLPIKMSAYGIIIFGLFIIAISFVMEHKYAVPLSLFNMVYCYIFLLLVSGYQWLIGVRRARFFFLSWIVLFIGFLIWALAVFVGLFPINAITSGAPYIGLLAQAALLSIALGDMILHEREERLVATADKKVKADFIAKMSHEIRTPMNGILGLSELLSFLPLNHQQKTYVEGVRLSGNKLVSLINDVLDIAKLEANKVELETMPVNIKEVISESILASEKGFNGDIELNASIDEALPHLVKVDGTRLGQVLTKLLYIAGSFTSESTIKLLVISEMASDFDVDISFEVHFRSTKCSKDSLTNLQSIASVNADIDPMHEELLLPLNLCIALIQRMGCQLNIKNMKGGGIGFCFTMRLSECDNELVTEDLALVDAKIDSNPEGDVKVDVSILVADDNNVNQMVIRGLLAKLGCTVIIANNGLEAVEAYRSNTDTLDLVLMDCEMPEMDGFEATTHIRLFEKERKLPRIPVVALTGHVLGDIIEQCRESGIDDQLTKPVTLDSVDRLLANYFSNFGSRVSINNVTSK